MGSSRNSVRYNLHHNKIGGGGIVSGAATDIQDMSKGDGL